MSKRQQPEWAAQCAVFEWARAAALDHDAGEPLKLLHASLNGVRLTKGQAGKAKAAGMESGVPDISLPVVRMILHPKGEPPGYGLPATDRLTIVPGLYIEMKVVYESGSKNYPSDEQKEWISRLRDQGYRVEVAYGAEAAIAIICEYLDLPARLGMWDASEPIRRGPIL